MSHVASAWHEAWRAASNLIFRLTNRLASDASRLILMSFFPAVLLEHSPSWRSSRSRSTMGVWTALYVAVPFLKT